MIQRRQKDHPAVEHLKDHHQGEEPKFSMRVIRKCKIPLERQAWEGHLIENFYGGKIINKKGKWGQNLAPKLILEEEKEKEVHKKRKGKGNRRIKDENRGRYQDDDDIGVGGALTKKKRMMPEEERGERQKEVEVEVVEEEERVERQR